MAFNANNLVFMAARCPQIYSNWWVARCSRGGADLQPFVSSQQALAWELHTLHINEQWPDTHLLCQSSVCGAHVRPCAEGKRRKPGR